MEKYRESRSGKSGFTTMNKSGTAKERSVTPTKSERPDTNQESLPRPSTRSKQMITLESSKTNKTGKSKELTEKSKFDPSAKSQKSGKESSKKTEKPEVSTI